MGYRHRKRYLPIYIKSGHISLYPLTPPDMLQTPPDMFQTPPDTIRHGPDTTRYHQTCISYGLYGLKHHIVEMWRCHRCGTDGRTNKQTTCKDRATQLLICEPLSFANWHFWSWMLSLGTTLMRSMWPWIVGHFKRLSQVTTLTRKRNKKVLGVMARK